MTIRFLVALLRAPIARAILTIPTVSLYRSVMENIMFKAPDGTKSKLRRINPNISALLREQVDRLLERQAADSVHDRASRLCGIIKGKRRNVATSKDYLKQYAPKRSA
jgi:hypothetical protein